MSDDVRTITNVVTKDHYAVMQEDLDRLCAIEFDRELAQLLEEEG